jgi:Na+-transporting NADH:ubiquinone oxidoreductase subunit C
MNTNSNTYTFIYSSVLVILVAAALAFTNGALKERQAKNVEVDKMQQILRSLKIEATYDVADVIYKKTVTKAYLVNNKGEVTDSSVLSAFETDISKEVGKPAAERRLPVYEATLNGEKKFILPVYGAGLWGPIWGYVALNADRNTIYAASFSHQGETPGLGAEINTLKFQKPFIGKQLFKNGTFKSVAVLKAGQKAKGMDAVDAISGGTITSKGVQAMLQNSLSAYESFLKKQDHELQ